MNQLDNRVQFLKGVGPRRAEALARMGILSARDLLYHVPRRYDDASTITPVTLAQVGMDVTAVGEVRSKGVVPTRSGLRIFQAVIQDDTGIITCAWPGQPWVERGMRVGDRILVTGPVKFFHGRQIQPREHTVLTRAADATPPPTPDPTSPGTIFAVYPASEELPQWVFRRVIAQNLDRLLGQVKAEEYLPPPERGDLMELSDALETLHRPRSLGEVDDATRRLAYDELFFLQLLQARERYRATRERPGIAFRRTNERIRALHERLPFTLTGAQIRALREIYADMTSPRRMSRMLQGDVGCGKTLVALFAMLLAAEGGYQAAMMAPTEILAEQHAQRMRDLGLNPELLVGSMSGSRKTEARTRIADGGASLVVGTHALIQEGVDFHSLGLVVVDEQHRFGVRQRMALAERDPAPDMLVMSATPIPRTLFMAMHGHLDISEIDELPPGRRPVTTRLIEPGERGEAFREVADRLDRGQQAYVVYPVIEESAKTELRAAETGFEQLRKEFAGREVALLHGRMPGEEKDEIMRGFLAGSVDVLVSTTVIEVGIDVPNATAMVIESAERFGLSQLHQLRGRIGRGDQGSVCYVIGPENVRLQAFARTTDGFEIAAEDLRIRGQGDLFGAEQHGHGPDFRFADIVRHGDLLATARDRARALIDADPQLTAQPNALIRRLLERRHGDRLKLFGLG